MIKQPTLLPECHADTLLVDMLIKSTSAHQPNINEVFKTLKLFAQKNRRAIGIIDDDKRKDRDPFYQKFKVVEKKENFKHLRHENGIHELIVTRGKGFERFIMLCAQEVGVEHKLLADFDRLRAISKSPNVASNDDIRSLINTLVQRQSPTLVAIQKILSRHLV